MSVVFTVNYSFSERGHPVNNETLFLADFMNIKIDSVFQMYS
jgi:hypothetical protein